MKGVRPAGSVVTAGKRSHEEELTDQVWGETGIKANSRVCA